MTSLSKTIIFFGTDEFSAVSLRRLIAEGFSIGAVVTKPDSRKGRGRELAPSIVKQIALEHSIPVWQPTKVADIIPNIQTFDSPLGVLVSYGKIIPQAVIDLFSPGIINVHPSLLPRYRGPSPIESAIANGDTTTGVSIMLLDARMDAGPIYRQVSVPLTGFETGPELEAKLDAIGANELCQTLNDPNFPTVTPTPQNDADATYCQLLTKDQALLTPTAITAIEAERHVRAFLAFPKTKVTIAGQPIVVTKAHVSNTGATILDLACRDGAFLSIDELIGPSGKRMTASAFLNGYAKK